MRREVLDIPQASLALGMGDWNILYSVSPARWKALEEDVTGAGGELARIGYVSSEPGIRWHSGGRTLKIQPVVNQHFAERLEDEGDLIERLRHYP